MLRKLISKLVADRRARNDGHVVSQEARDEIFQLGLMALMYSWNGFSKDEKDELKEQCKTVVGLL